MSARRHAEKISTIPSLKYLKMSKKIVLQSLHKIWLVPLQLKKFAEIGRTKKVRNFLNFRSEIQ